MNPDPATELEGILHDIVATETGDAVGPDVASAIRELLFEDGMDTEEQTPEWITEFFRALRDRQPLEVTPQPDATTDAEVSEFFYDLQQIESLDCYDHGEWVRVKLPKHGMLGLFSIQFAYYTVVRLDDVDDSGDSDLSAAKIHPGSSA